MFWFFHYIFSFFFTVLVVHSHHDHPITTVLTHCTLLWHNIGLDTCYNATYMSQTRDQQRFTILEGAADYHEPMVPQRIM